MISKEKKNLTDREMIRRFDSTTSVHLASDSSYDSRSVGTVVKVTSTTNIFDEVLVPLIAESNRSTKSKGILFTISAFVVTIQVILGSFFCIIENKQIPNELQIISEVFFLGYSHDSYFTDQRFIMLAIMLFSFVVLGIIIINFKYITHEFSKATLFFVRLWFGDLFIIFIIPTFVFTVGSFMYYGTHPQVQNAFFSFVHVILLFLCFFISRYITENLARNIYITNSPTFLWKTIPYFNAIFIYGVSFSACPLTVIFKDWAENIPQVLLLIVSPFISYNLMKKCFQTPFLNAISISVPVFSFLGALMSLINNNYDDLPQIIYFIIPVVGFLVSHIAYTIYLAFYKNKKIKEQLSQNIDLTDEEKLQLFESMKISHNDKCYYCLIGLINKSPLFLNWSLTHYLIDRDPEDMDFLTFATWMVSFFPSETRIMNSYLGIISKYPYLTFSERCSFFQLHRIYVLRESSSSTSLEAAADFRPVHDQSEKVIAYISNFWRFAASDPEEIHDSIFHQISKEQKQARTMWTDLLEKYPNNAQMMHDYSRYLANGESKYQKAIQCHQKAILIESGAVAKNDKAFKCFLLRFPEYLKRGYVNNKGMLVMSKVMMRSDTTESTEATKGTKLNDISYMSMNSSEANFTSSSSNSINFDSSTNSSEVDLLAEKQIDMEEAKSFIKMTELRIAMEKSLEQYRSPVSYKIWIASIIRLILSLALCLIIFFIIFFEYPENEVLFNHLTKFNRAFHLFELVTNLYPWSWMGPNIGHGGNEFFFTEGIRFHQTYVNISSDNIAYQIANLSKIILEHVDQFSYDLYSADNSDSSTDFVTFYSQVMLDNKQCIELDDDNVEIQEEKESITLDSLFKTVITVFLKLSSSDDQKKQNWSGKDNYCDMFTQTLLLQQYTKELIQMISPSVDDLFFEIIYEDEDESGLHSLKNKKIRNKKYIMDKNEKYLLTNKNVNTTDFENNIDEYDTTNINDYNALDEQYQIRTLTRRRKPRISTRIKSFFSKSFISFKNAISSLFINNDSEKTTSKISQKNKKKFAIPKKNTKDDSSSDEEEDFNPNFFYIPQDDDDKLSIHDFFIGFIPFFVALFSFPTLIFLSSSLNKEKEDLVTLLIGTSKEEATAASHVVTGKASTVAVQMSSSSNKSYAWLRNCISLIIVIACLMIIVGMTKLKREKQETYIQHFAFTLLERNFVFDIGRDLFYSIIYQKMENGGFKFNSMIFLDSAASTQNMMTDFDYFNKITHLIREGSKYVPPVPGFDSKIDKLRYDEKCYIKDFFNKDDYYFQDCISLDRLITYFVGQSKMTFTSKFAFDIENLEFIYLNSLIITRFTRDYEELANLYEERFNDQSHLFNIISVVFFVLAIISTIGAFFIELFLLLRFHNEISIFRTLVLRLNPLYFVSNPDLLSTVYKNGKNEKAVTSSSHAMFQTAHDALFILKEDLIIESVNPAATNIFGFTPEQMLGQNIKFILPNDLNSSTYYVVDLMMSGATSLNYESDATGTKDDGSDVPLRLSVIGLTQDKNNGENQADSYELEAETGSNNNEKENKESQENNQENQEEESQEKEQKENNEANDDNNNAESAANNDDDKKVEKVDSSTRSITGGKKATAFAFIMKDMTEEQRQKVAVEEAKKQAEVILLQILPKDIIMRLNRGDKDITFTVDSATIVFCDIEKFSQYSATLSAKDIMLNLSRIFTAFDKICSTFNLITKIKMIGDDYMAAAGLFTPDINPQEHATQVVQFAMQCHEALEEQNVILNSNLQVRIGINTDGPIIAGVLGTEKPLFDIIGDPINVASRLQSTCIPGLIQISEGTYKLVANMDYKIEERGEIMLKGKGKRKTFLIYPETHEQTKAFMDQDSSIGSSSILKQIVNADPNSTTLTKKKNPK